MRFRDIDAVRRLISNRISESSTLEYKSQLVLAGSETRKELLKDLTGMGNGGGGSIVFGMTEVEGVGVAQELAPLPSSAIVGQIEDIVRDSVHPPLVWSSNTFESDGGWIVVTDIEPSTLGPYMIDAYGEQRYYKRSGTRVHRMSEQEVRDAYAVALRTTEYRDQLWAKHMLPISLNPREPWLLVSALSLEPLRAILDARTVDLSRFVNPPPLTNYMSHTGLPFVVHGLRHWRDGLAGDDGANGREPTCILRLHRDGAAGIARKGALDIRVDWAARIINAYLLYLAWFWSEFSLARPVELELSLIGLANATLPAHTFSTSPVTVVQPAGVRVNDVAVTEEMVPWELLRAPVRHRLLRRFCDRLEQAFGRASAGDLFEWGWLYDRDCQRTDYVLSRGMIWEPRAATGLRVASISTSGFITSATSVGDAFLVDGAVLDAAGNTLAVLEMACGSGCPDDFLPDAVSLEEQAPQQAGIEPDSDPSDALIPVPTGRWSERLLSEALA